MTGKFIVFEGIDGSGTSTQSELLKRALTKKGIKCHTTCEPSNGPIGNMIRQIFKGRLQVSIGINPNIEGGSLFDEQMAYLFAADRHDHLYNTTDGISKILSEGTHVISTRYYFSSYAYHCLHQADFDLVRSLNSRFPSPDIVIYLDNPTEVSINRLNERAFKETYENKDKLTLAKSNYEKAFNEYLGKLVRINATLDIESIHRNILDEVSKVIGH